jgi:hypothetical protein
MLRLALALRHRSGWPLAAALPYLALASRRSSLRHPRTAKVVAADLAADGLTLASLIVGSVRAKSLLL